MNAASAGSVQRVIPPEYPQAADEKIRAFADLPMIGRPDIFRLLDDIRDRLLGNAVGIQELAFTFADNATIRGAREDVDKAVQSLAGTWTGRAAEQFTTYASRVAGALDKEQEAVAGVSSLMSGLARVVIETYVKAIEFLGVCAGELARVDIQALLAALTSWIPGVNLVAFADVIATVVDALGALVENFIGLVAAAVGQIGDFCASAVAFQQTKNNFVEIPDLPTGSGMEKQKQWKIEPDAFPE